MNNIERFLDDEKELNMINRSRVAADVIDFAEYGDIDADYSKEELAEIYKKIIRDISEGKR